MPNNLVRKLTNVIFPPHCLSCNKPGSWICNKCGNLLLVNSIPECAVCRTISTGFTTHPHCFNSLPIDKVVICWQYNKLARKIMNTFKRNLRYAIVEQLVELCFPRVSGYFCEKSILVPVPSTKNRIKSRGFNQSKIIANYIAEKSKSKVEEILCRTSDSEHQTGQTLEKRIAQDLTTFRINETSPRRIRGKNIILIDDVCTTGTTLKNCALALKPCASQSISAFALFRGKRLSASLSAKRARTAGTGGTRGGRRR